MYYYLNIIFLFNLINCKYIWEDERSHINWPMDTQTECGVSNEDRIVGGINVSIGQYPWLARIGYYKNGGIKYQCGGTLISKRYVLTAAHCITNLEANVIVSTIVLGENNENTDPDCEDDVCADPIQVLEPIRIVLPYNYNKPLMKHDIALIKLRRDAIITEWVSPVCLPYGEMLSKNLISGSGIVSGWGLTNSNNLTGSSYLQAVKLNFKGMEFCHLVYKNYITLSDEQLCVGGEMGKDSCSGDSGGPIVKAMNSMDGPKYFIFGVVSFGSKDCGNPATPGICTNIKYYLDWILDNMI